MRLRSRSTLTGLVFATAAVLVSCKDEKATPQGAPPPPPPPSAPAGQANHRCDRPAPPVTDATYAPVFSAKIEGYCLDPETEFKAYGPKDKYNMDEVCTTAFDGECEIYKGFGVSRVVHTAYADSKGAGTVDVYVSTFRRKEGSFGLYTKRIVGDRDPTDPTTPKSIPGVPNSVIGTGSALVWKGTQLAEIRYLNENESPEALTKSANAILPAIAKQLSVTLPQPVPDAVELPPAVRVLPKDKLVPNGVEFGPIPLGSAKLDDTAVGFYKDGPQRHRRLVSLRADEGAAKGVMKAIASQKGAVAFPGLGDEATSVITKSEAGATEYLFARKGWMVLGIADESYGDAKTPLPREEKAKRLKEWLENSGDVRRPSAPPPPEKDDPGPARPNRLPAGRKDP